MSEIKPTWRIAQEISKCHTFISLKITLPLTIAVILLSILVLKIVGYEHCGIVLKQFYDYHKTSIIWGALFIHLVPVNFYAIMRLFYTNFSNFEVKLTAKDLSGQKK